MNEPYVQVFYKYGGFCISPQKGLLRLNAFYNAAILSRLLAYKEAIGDSAGSELLKSVSPVSWQHINLYGRYEFTKKLTPIDRDTIVETLAQRLSLLHRKKKRK